MTTETKPTICQVCGLDVNEYNRKEQEFEKELGWLLGTTRIVRHHWRGYDYPEDIWWVCAKCNRRLVGKHDGSLTLQQAQKYVKGVFFPVIPNPNRDCWGNLRK